MINYTHANRTPQARERIMKERARKAQELHTQRAQMFAVLVSAFLIFMALMLCVRACNWAMNVTPDSPAPTITITNSAPVIAPVASVQSAPVKSSAAPKCEEDMPCWDCKTMGNKKCGRSDSATNGKPVISTRKSCNKKGQCITIYSTDPSKCVATKSDPCYVDLNGNGSIEDEKVKYGR